ncbi:AlbA family DNA-binding domain-containing protein [Kaistella carnis]|uniref:Uncharacterized protein n=1 Tax=Kaistella carnis TaxID=1241979 RepID=A0A3G8XJM6_9FLAO|nr:hypothetical protein [Kaistella carnis]AZI32988.1 hypothetical protein EIB73_07295 [Kaistella carnis]
METKKPLLSYVVKTQYVTNKAGLKTLYQKVFTYENILTARQNAFEYYEAAIGYLKSENEIEIDENSGKITYKNPEKYDRGIAIYMRINEDVNKFGIVDQAETLYIIGGHFDLSTRDKNRLKLGKNTEEKYFKLLKIKSDANQKENLAGTAKRLQSMAELNRIKETSLEKIDFIGNVSAKESLEQLLESSCAFLNTEGGTIIFGQYQAMDDKKDQHLVRGMAFIMELLLPLSYPFEQDHFTFKKRSLLGRQFLEITITKSGRDCFYNEHFYYRCATGNVLDLDKNFS